MIIKKSKVCSKIMIIESLFENNDDESLFDNHEIDSLFDKHEVDSLFDNHEFARRDLSTLSFAKAVYNSRSYEMSNKCLSNFT